MSKLNLEFLKLALNDQTNNTNNIILSSYNFISKAPNSSTSVKIILKKLCKEYDNY